MDFLYSCNYPKLVNKVIVFLFNCFAKQKKEVIFNHLFLFF